MDSEGEDDIVWFVDNAPSDLFSRHKRSLVLRSVNTSLDRLGKRYGEVEDQHTISDDEVEAIISRLSGRFKKNISKKSEL